MNVSDGKMKSYSVFWNCLSKTRVGDQLTNLRRRLQMDRRPRPAQPKPKLNQYPTRLSRNTLRILPPLLPIIHQSPNQLRSISTLRLEFERCMPSLRKMLGSCSLRGETSSRCLTGSSRNGGVVRATEKLVSVGIE